MKKTKRKSLVPLMDKRIHKLLKRKNLTLKEELAILNLARAVEKSLGQDDDEYGADLPGVE